MRTRTFLGLLLLLTALVGCGGGGPSFAPVSGQVFLNGEPYGNAVLSFQPIGSEKNPNPGRGSSGETDPQGKFSLKTDEGQKGAVVGKHLVRIMTKGDSPAIVDPNVGSPDGDPKVVTKPRKEVIPREWYAPGKEIEIPPGGKLDLKFEITTEAPAKKK